MSNTTKKLIEEYYVGKNLDTTKLVGHDVVFYRKDEPAYKDQKKVTDAFEDYIKFEDSYWMNVNADIVLLFVIENVIPEIKATEYSGTKVHNEQAETAWKIQEAIKKLQDERNDWAKAIPPVSVPWPIYPDKFPPPSSRCGKCGLELSGVMCYSCPHGDCPCGMGPTWCQNPHIKGYETDQDYLERTTTTTTLTDGTNVCCGGNCPCSSSTGEMP